MNQKIEELSNEELLETYNTIKEILAYLEKEKQELNINEEWTKSRI